MNPLNRTSIKSLYFFSIISQYRSLAEAAEFLCISPSALSHQMKRLEKSLNVTLFERQGNRTVLTEESMVFAKNIHQNFQEISNQTKRFANLESKTLQLGVQSAFAVNRLSSALSLWLNAHPDLDIRVKMLNCDDNLDELDLDIVFSGKLSNQNYSCELIADEVYVPVCSRSLYGKIKEQTIEEILEHQTCYELDNVFEWEHWKRANQIETIFQISKQYFNHSLLLVKAVLSGQGLAILEKSVVADFLKRGELVALQDFPLRPEGAGYYFSVHARNRLNKNVDLLKTFLAELVS